MTVKRPDGRMFFINKETFEKEPYVFSDKGKYLVTFVVYDGEMNTGEISYVVTVK